MQTAAGHRCATSNNDATTGSNTDPATTRTRYDALGRITDITDALGHTTSTTYDAVGNPLTTTAANGTKTIRTFDADNRLLTLTRGASAGAGSATGGTASTTSYGYDLASGGVVGSAGTVATAANTCPATVSWCNTTTDARGKTTLTGVDLLGRVVTTITPDGKSSTSRYDASGNIVESTDEAGRATKNSYDADTGLLTGVTYSDPGTPAVSYTYDADARRTSMTDGTGTSTYTYTYDVTGRPVSITDGAGNVIKYGYDAIGRTTSLTYPNGQAITRDYDNGGRVAAITDWAKRRTTFTYDADGDLTATTYPNGVQVANAYDTLARLSSSTLTNSSGTTLAGIAQTRDASGLTTRESGTGATAGTLDYSYDTQNRLTGVNTTAAASPNGSASFGYDAVNNPTNLAGASQTFNDNGQLTTTTARTLAAAGTTSATGASTTFGYDALGQRTAAWSTDANGAAAGTSYGYDQAGRLTSVTAAPTVTKLDVTAGPLAGGNTITVSGTHLSGTTAVRFGGLDATSFTVKSATTLSVTVPAGVQVGAVDVSVSTATGGTSLSSTLSSYAYLEAPSITKVDANLGPLAGGSVTTLTGTHFADVNAVSVGGKPATSFKVNSDTSLTVTVPATTSTTTLTVDIAVTSPTRGTNTAGSPGQFTYLAAPVITSLDPASGPGVGGTLVTVTGTDFTGLQSVKVGGKGVNARYSPTTITFTVPAGRGSVDVVITTIGGTSTTSTATKFTYTGVPTVTAIAPASGPGVGGTTVTLTGTNFTGTTGVKFGTQDATSFSVISDTSIQANAPPGSGTVDVVVTTATGGASATSSGDQFTYTGVPTVTKLSSQAGPLAGGTSITLTGTNLTGATAVKFGTVAATNVKVVSDTSITATIPASGTSTTSTVNVTVTTPTGGTSPNAVANAYVYAAAPTITSISPTTATAGDTVTITGTDFVGLSAIKFGTLGASGSYSNTSITTTVPSGGAGTVDLAITAAGGTSTATTASKFTFKTTAPSITTISPTAGPVAGGTSVTLTGINFTGATAVKFGTVAAKSFTVNSATSITAVSAAGSAATVDITVTTPAGTSTTSAASKFTYAAAPTVTKLTPATGTTSGGTTVTVTGTNLTGASAVKFGSIAATQVTVTSATTLTAVAPAAAAGAVDVTVTTPGGTSATSTADKFTYTAPAPAITAITPPAGPVAGGSSVVITGTNLTGASAVKFGTVAAKSFTVNSATQITAVAPAGTAGTVDLTVTTATGTSATSTADKFTFTAAPTVTKLSPTSGTTAGGTSVTLTGTNLSGATAVKFGTIAAKSFTVNSATSITAVTAAGTAGAVNVTVTTAGGTSATATANQFTYSKTATLSAPQAAQRDLKATPATGAATSALGPDTLASYAYNGAGLRVAKTTSAGTSSFVYDPSTTVPQLLTDGTASYLYGPDGAALAQISSTGEINYFFHDQRSSTRALINSAGAISATYAYNAYGSLIASTGTVSTPLRFTGGYTDSETGFVYLINRYYDPATAQFISIDPAVVATLQAYAYANADPINGVDPLGLFGWDTVSSLAAGFGDTVTFGGTKQIRRLINYELNGDTNDFDTVNPCSLAYKVGGGLGFAAGLITGETELQLLNAAREANSVARVGRWMSEVEHEAMLRTGMVQEGAGGTTFVASPADVMSYLKQAAAGTRYVEFDVPVQSLRAAGKEGWAQIAGPNSLAGRLASKRGEPLPSFPLAKNIEWVASKIR
ncbi:IPT/TIG domain-containing protein [Kineococcus sp. NBC_00420]|uniref:IPT/TIG domain-containing protein n=1 Tax=Kineococcus sp. NBC_00420 TaxID=2903564 RepID=UPI002E204F31